MVSHNRSLILYKCRTRLTPSSKSTFARSLLSFTLSGSLAKVRVRGDTPRRPCLLKDKKREKKHVKGIYRKGTTRVSRAIQSCTMPLCIRIFWLLSVFRLLSFPSPDPAGHSRSSAASYLLFMMKSQSENWTSPRRVSYRQQKLLN